jgi:hypothetical protein
MGNNIPLAYSDQVSLRFEPNGHCYVWSPYNAAFVADIKQAFNSPEVRATFTIQGCDNGAEWDSILGAWYIYTGWIGCEHWIDILEDLLSKHYPK